MLEADEVDDDFFTPVAGTSLANIFGNVKAKNEESVENESLKYIPPKPQNIVPKTKEQTKVSECVFACALIGHEWCNNIYTSRGNIGFAIVKIQRTGAHNIVLYDSNKTTLSSATISTKLEITIKNNSYISYYDDLQKYWSIYGKEDKTNKIAELLKNCGATIHYSSYSNEGPPEPKPDNELSATLEDSVQQTMESDTDSSINRKTKASILNRMASMGHSVLPSRGLQTVKSSDSSDTNEIETQHKVVRHKPVKNSVKRNSIENIVSEHQNLTEAHQKIIAAKTEPQKNVAIYNSPLMPLANTSVIASTSNEFGMLMSEQRISNSELRININRITDKVDSVLDKINNLGCKEQSSDISTNILLKLLTEYENKIKVYEELLKPRGTDDKSIIGNGLKYSNKDSEVEALKNRISKYEKENMDKSNEICTLQEEMRLLKDKYSQEIQNQKSKEQELLTKINNIEEDCKVKSKELSDLTNNISTEVRNDNIGEKVKNIMNDTFQTISVNFENNESYTGETIKRIIGTVIKKMTIQTLSEL